MEPTQNLIQSIPLSYLVILKRGLFKNQVIKYGGDQARGNKIKTKLNCNE